MWDKPLKVFRYRYDIIGLLFILLSMPGIVLAKAIPQLQISQIPNSISQQMQQPGRVNTGERHRQEIRPETALPAGVETSWWAQVQKDLQQREYHITWLDNPPLNGVKGAWQAPNRSHNLRTYFTQDGILVVPRTQSDDGLPWKWGLRLNGYGFAGQIEPVADATLHTQENRIEYRRKNLVEWYVNDTRGLEQGFTLLEPPSHNRDNEAEVVLSFTVTGNLEAQVIEEDGRVTFNGAGPGGARILELGELKAFDAEKKPLPIHFALHGRQLKMQIATANAVFPLTVDPLLTTAAWSAFGGQVNGGFGAAVAGAGDVNGDGYSDVIVGADSYDTGFADEGAVFVYLGAATGLSVSPDWSVLGVQAYARFGYSVASAGDVNGDGYSDVIVGARLYDNSLTDEGGAFVYLGSAMGLSASPDWSVFGGQAGAFLGVSVASAGDVNGDGYSDVIVGSNGYDSVFTDEGTVYVYLGSAGGLSATPVWSAFGGQASAFFGISVASAGDVNGDGYSDAIVGAYLFDNSFTDEGAAYVYLGTAGGLSTTPAWSTFGGKANSDYGVSVAGAGDINGDGYSDVIVGAEAYDNTLIDEGAAFVYMGTPSGLSATAAWSAFGGKANAFFGNSVASAGDVNGDGYSDVIVGSTSYDNVFTAEGAAFVYLGSAGGLSATSVWSAFGGQAFADFGLSVAGVGDANGDGYSDVIVGAYRYDNGSTDEGAAFVYMGAPGGLSATAAWSTFGGQADTRIGVSVAGAGDVNGDGYIDVIVGAEIYDNTFTGEGAAFVYLGTAGGLSTSPVWSAFGGQVGASFGFFVAGAGDVNGDGYGDVIVGAPGYDNGFTDEGAAYVYLGASGGLSASVAWSTFGGQASANFGSLVADAGDVNGDGFSDVVVGAPFFDNGFTDEGAAYVYLGASGGLSPSPAWSAFGGQAVAGFGALAAGAGDINGDGYGDVIVGAPGYDNGFTDEGAAYVYLGTAGGLSSSAAWSVFGGQAYAYFGFSVASSGDVNGDGYSDVIVGAWQYDNGNMDEGAAYVYLGASGGLSTSPAWSAYGGKNMAGFGYSVAESGDVNGDGYSDVIVGTWQYNNGFVDEGAAFVYLGGAGGLSASPAWSAYGGQAGAHFGWSVAGTGDVNGDGYSDVIVGAPSYNNGLMNEGAAYVYYGNEGAGLSIRPQMRQGDDSVPIVTGTSTFGAADFRLAALGRSPQGRGFVKLEWEVKPFGTAFDGTGTSTSASWTEVGGALGVIPLNELISGLTLGERYHWRMRLRYDLVTSVQTASRWLSPTEIGWQEMAFRTTDDSTPVVPLAVTITTVTDGTQGAAYSQTLTATGGATPYTWSISAGSLPAGLSLNSSTGEISGTPTAAGTYNFTVQVTDALSATATQALSMTVLSAGVCIPTPTGTSVAISPHPDVAMTYATVSVAGDTCVNQSGTGPAAPTGYRFSALSPFYDITTLATFAGNINVCLNFNPTNYGAISTLRLFHHNGTSWDDITTSLDTVGNVICGTTASLSPFAIGEEYSTAITLSDFSATKAGDRVVINWTTSSETDNWGFKVLRSESPNGPFTPITSSLIPARGGPGLVMTYTYTDNRVEAGKQYYYRLEDVDTKGLVTAQRIVPVFDPSRSAGTALASTASPAKGTSTVQSASQPRSPHARAKGATVVARDGSAGTLLLPSGVLPSRREANVADGQKNVTADVATADPVPALPATIPNRHTVASGAAYSGADPVYAHGSAHNMGVAGNQNQGLDDPAAVTFAVTVEDERGNVVDIRLLDDKASTSFSPGLEVSEEAGLPVIRWQVGKLTARGFRVLRTPKGKNDYQPVVSYVPNYGEDDSGVFEYIFTDRSAKMGETYDYRLDILKWGVQTAALH